MPLWYVALIHVKNMRHIVYLILTLNLLVMKKLNHNQNCSAAPALAGL